MPIRRNDSDCFPGANSIFVPPVTKADCCLFSAVQKMMEHAEAEGWPATVKGGRCFVEASLAQIQTVCLIGEPTVSYVSPDPLMDGATWHVYGTNYGTTEGEVWLTNGATWAGSVLKVKQNVSAWLSTHLIMGVPVVDGLPMFPEHVWVYVINDCGERNAVGHETEITII